MHEQPEDGRDALGPVPEESDLHEARLAIYRRSADAEAVRRYQQLDHEARDRQMDAQPPADGADNEQAATSTTADRRPPRQARTRRIGVAALGIAVISAVALPGLSRHNLPKPAPRPSAVAQTVPLTAAEQDLLRQLLTTNPPPLDLLGARTEGDVNQTLDTAGTVSADGSLTAAASLPNFGRGIATRQVPHRVDLRRATRLRLIVLTARAAELHGAVAFIDATRRPVEVQPIAVSAGATGLSYLVLQPPPTARAADVVLSSGPSNRIFWSIVST